MTNTEDQNGYAEDESDTSSRDTSRVAVVGQDDVGGQEAAAATASNEGIPASERLWISDFTVSGTGASFTDTKNEDGPNQQLDHVTVDGLYATSTSGLVAYL